MLFVTVSIARNTKRTHAIYMYSEFLRVLSNPALSAFGSSRAIALLPFVLLHARTNHTVACFLYSFSLFCFSIFSRSLIRFIPRCLLVIVFSLSLSLSLLRRLLPSSLVAVVVFVRLFLIYSHVRSSPPPLFYRPFHPFSFHSSVLFIHSFILSFFLSSYWIACLPCSTILFFAPTLVS